MKNAERRYYPVDFRAESADEKRVLRGHAAVFNSLSEDLGGFREKIEPGAFATALEEEDDVRALFNHDPNLVLGRSPKTLRMEEDEVGLAVEIDVADTQTGRDVYHLVERGDVSQMSFGFIVTDDRWEKVDGENIRTIVEARLFDVSPVTYPAYPATDVSVRSQLPAEAKAKLEELEHDADEKNDNPTVSNDVRWRRIKLAETY